MKIGEKRHIGDGVYVEYDGYHVILKANSSDIPTDTIHLDAGVQIALRNILVEILPGKQEETIDESESPKWKPLPDYGDLFAIKDFLRSYESGYFTDYDGHGFLATSEQMSDIGVSPSTMREHADRKEFTHVMWFNK